MMDFEQFTEGRKLSPREKKKEDDLIKAISDIDMEDDDFDTYLRLKKVSIDGKVSKPITISKIDSGRNTGVPQLEILNDEIFVVWTVFENENNQLKTVKLSSKDI